ncbi:MAG: C-type cytochrome [Campylobacterota bacterium]|nr:C-type cytochrome [Campylobacterota bacterium]
MKKLLKIAVASPIAALLMSGCAPSTEKTVELSSSDTSCKSAEQGAVVASKFDGNMNDAASLASAWKNASCTSVMLYPQKTVHSNDKNTNGLMADAKGVKASVKALYNDQKIALMVYWDDSEASYQGESADKYSDGFAIQFAKDSSDPKKLPYVGMGSDDRPVVIYMQKSTKASFEPNGNGKHDMQLDEQSLNKFGEELKDYDKEVAKLGDSDFQKAFVAEGFRSTTELRDAKNSFNADMVHENGKWRGTFVKDIKDANLELSSEFPIALAIWDGNKENRDGQKWLSSWVAVELGKTQGNLEKAVTSVPNGNVANGKTLAVENCAACHIFDDQKMASAMQAPDLSALGGQSTAEYIIESLKNPSAVVVPGYNRNAYPNFKWYELADGKRVSTMPAYDWMSEEQLNDLAAYFKTLK